MGFFLSRALNAVLLLAQLALVTTWYRPAGAAAFFVTWTVGWCAAVWLRFGFDQLLPKHAARAQIAEAKTAIPSYRPLLLRTLPPLVVVVVPLLAALLPRAGLATLLEAAAACLLIAVAWSLTTVLGGLARGYGHVGLAGLVQGVVPSIGALAAVPVAALIDRSWVVLALAVSGCLVASTLVATWLVIRRVGREPVQALVSPRAQAFDRDLVPAALVSAFGETGLWLPVWLASGLGVSARGVAGLYAAARIASAFSWLAATVAAVATPLLAAALARGDQPMLRRLIMGSSIASALVSAPAALVGIVFARPLIGALGGAYAEYGGLLQALIAGRFVDACTGPLGEALIVGNRARLELANMVVFVLSVVGFGFVLEPSLGVLGLAVATAMALAACNIPRVAAVAILVRRGWGTLAEGPSPVAPSPPPPIQLRTLVRLRARLRRPTLGVAAREQVGLLVCLGAAALLAAGVLDRGTIAAFILALALVIVSLLLVITGARRAGGGSLTALARSPVSLICALWAALFVLRPLDLFFDPRGTTVPLYALGFSRSGLTWAVAIGALGCAAWGIGYLLLFGVSASPPGAPRRRRRPAPALPMGPATVLLAFGTILWGALFMRQGGPSALLHHAASIRAGQQSSFYGIAGVWIVQATGLFAFDRLLRGGGRRALVIVIAAAVLSVMAAVALELRGLLVLAGFAAVAIYLNARPPGRRSAMTGAVAALVAVAVLAFAERVRSYTQTTSTSHAVTLALETPPSTYAVADLTPFDNLVTVGELVPRSVPPLDGSSLLAIPSAFVPRGLWPGKPQPVDQQVSKYLYPGTSVGSPISMQGELWWNFGWPGVLAGAALLGAIMGAVTRRGLFARSEHGRLLYAVFFASAFAPMVSALATMGSNTAIALVAAAVTAFVLGRPKLPRALSQWARDAVRRGLSVGRRWVQGPAHAGDGLPAPTGGVRFPLVDSVRGIAATCVLVCHAGALLYYPAISSYANWAGPLGVAAVYCFFVTSGFVLYRPFVVARAGGTAEPSTRAFLKRRLLRIAPAYWVALTLSGIALPAVVPGVLSPHGWIYYLLVSNYAPGFLYAGGLLVAWTLQIELTFYFALPVIAALVGRFRPRRGLAVRRELAAAAALLLIGVSVVTAVAGTESSTVWLRTLAGGIGWFAIGMALAVVSVLEETRGIASRVLRALGRTPLLMWVGAAAAFAGAVAQNDFPTAANPAPAVTPVTYLTMDFLCVVAGLLLVLPAILNAGGGGVVRRLLATPALRWLGEVSFGIYLYHYPIVYAFVRSGILANAHIPRLVELTVLTFVGTAACATLSWYLVERPFIQLGRRRKGSVEPGPAAAVVPVGSLSA
jgi:peptidoglycan/LPS O-acetylase OafA/YrhL/O-antigen/teichoic acid export membrane protein